MKIIKNRRNKVIALLMALAMAATATISVSAASGSANATANGASASAWGGRDMLARTSFTDSAGFHRPGPTNTGDSGTVSSSVTANRRSAQYNGDSFCRKQ